MPTELLINAPNYAYIARELNKAQSGLGRQMGAAVKDAAKPIVPALRTAVLSGRTTAGATKKDAKARRAAGVKTAPRRASGGAKARAGQALEKSAAYRTAVANDNLLSSANTRARKARLERNAATGYTNVQLGDGTRRRASKTSLRAAVAKGIQIDQRTSGRRAGVTVRTRTSLLPADQKALPRLLNRGSWRHPVFGNREVWVEQQSPVKGWWNDTMATHRPKVEAAVRAEFMKWIDRLDTEVKAAAAWQRDSK